MLSRIIARTRRSDCTISSSDAEGVPEEFQVECHGVKLAYNIPRTLSGQTAIIRSRLRGRTVRVRRWCMHCRQLSRAALCRWKELSCALWAAPLDNRALHPLAGDQCFQPTRFCRGGSSNHSPPLQSGEVAPGPEGKPPSRALPDFRSEILEIVCGLSPLPSRGTSRLTEDDMSPSSISESACNCANPGGNRTCGVDCSIRRTRPSRSPSSSTPAGVRSVTTSPSLGAQQRLGDRRDPAHMAAGEVSTSSTPTILTVRSSSLRVGVGHGGAEEHLVGPGALAGSTTSALASRLLRIAARGGRSRAGASCRRCSRRSPSGRRCRPPRSPPSRPPAAPCAGACSAPPAAGRKPSGVM